MLPRYAGSVEPLFLTSMSCVSIPVASVVSISIATVSIPGLPESQSWIFLLSSSSDWLWLLSSTSGLSALSLYPVCYQVFVMT